MIILACLHTALVLGWPGVSSGGNDTFPRDDVRLVQGDVGWGKAPDGERGFGDGRLLRDLAHLLRSTAEEDRAFVATLYKLEGDVRVLLALVIEHTKEQGYFGLLARGADEAFEPLVGAFRARVDNASAEIAEGGPQADLLARMLADARFRARTRVLDGFEFEAQELRCALALLFAHLDGWADLREPEAEALARRADLASARLRAMRLDLEALRESRESEGVNAPSQADLEHLLVLARSKDAAKVEKELPPILARLDAREDQMCAALFTTRQAAQLEGAFNQRAAACASAQEALPQVRELLPETAEGSKASKDIAALSKNRRYSYAARAAVEALSFDPLNEELDYWAGVATDFLYGSIESRRWFDRFLALHGIRAHDHRTYQDKRLTREEQRALDAVQRVIGQPR